MLKLLIVSLAIIGSAVSRPQTITKSGEIGVDFLGFKASVGGNGGLSARAETPFGQAAEAGIGGSANGDKSSGGAYAGATAGSGIQANAGIGGRIGDGDSEGVAGASASAGGNNPAVYKKTVTYSNDAPASSGSGSSNADASNNGGNIYRKTVVFSNNAPPPPSASTNKRVEVAASTPSNNNNQQTYTFQKFYGFKNIVSPSPVTVVKEYRPVQTVVKYSPFGWFRKTFRPVNRQTYVRKEVVTSAPVRKEVVATSDSAPNTYSYSKNVNVGGGLAKQGFFDAIFQIPIATLTAVNNFLNTKAQSGFSYNKRITVENN